MDDAVIDHEEASSSLPVQARIEGPRELSLLDYEAFIGISTNITALKQFVSLQATHHQPVLIIGERGLRQEQIGRALHQASQLRALPFFAVNAQSLGTDALHHLLFGPGGVIESCRQGVIYVNELTSLPPLVQQRFAACLEEQSWQARSGRAIKQRLIFATEWSPEEINAENRIAYGLVELLRPHSFSLRPLRERSEDIPPLATYLAGRIARRHNKGEQEITPAAMKAMAQYPWEKNIDELEAVLESVIAWLPPHQIDEELLPSRIRSATLRTIPPSGIDLPQMVDDFERAVIETALRQTGGNQTRASHLLQLRVQTLNMKLKRFAISDRHWKR